MRHFNGYLFLYLGLGLAALGIHSFAPQSAHIIVSTVAIMIISVASLQAVAITAQNYLLKKHPGHSYPILRWLPPMDTLRNMLFKTIWAGFIFLSISFLGAFIFLPNVMQNIPKSKIIFASLAWGMFAGMLYGYQRSGWSHDIVSIRTLIGLFLLIATYFGSKLIG